MTRRVCKGISGSTIAGYCCSPFKITRERKSRCRCPFTQLLISPVPAVFERYEISGERFVASFNLEVNFVERFFLEGSISPQMTIHYARAVERKAEAKHVTAWKIGRRNRAERTLSRCRSKGSTSAVITEFLLPRCYVRPADPNTPE